MKDRPELVRMRAKADKLQRNPPSKIEAPGERMEIAKEILRINSALTKGDWQKVIDGVNMIKEKWPQFDHSGLDKVSARAASEIEKAHVKAEADKAKLEVELERANLETDKARFETARIKADNEKSQACINDRKPKVTKVVPPAPDVK